MNTPIPQIEINPSWNNPPIYSQDPWFRSRRFQIFIITLIVSISISLIYVFSRPAIYQSYATLLTVAKTAIDEQSAEADIQHVMIQKQTLLGYELLAETAKRLSILDIIKSPLTIADIRQMLNVMPIEETNLLKMSAESSNPQLLPLLINNWIDVYLEARAKEVAQLKGSTSQLLKQEVDDLSKTIDLKRKELDQFRALNKITSSGAEENKALARQIGLNDSLNTASEEKVKAKALMQSVQNAINRGELVVPVNDTRTLSVLEQQAQILRKQISDLEQRFTQDYMSKIAKFKVLPEQLLDLENKISKMRQSGQSIVLEDAKQKYAAAAQAVSVILKQLKDNTNQATDFVAKFTKHESLRVDLDGLEVLLRTAQERLITIEAKQTQKYPQVDVVERAFLPRDPIRPNYLTDALIAIIGSIILALLSVWITEYLTRKEQQNAAINLSGIHMYNNGGHRQQDALGQASKQALYQQQNLALENVLPQEISNQDFDILIQAANHKGKQLISLLLSGLTLKEISLLHIKDIDLNNDILSIQGTSARKIPLNYALKIIFSNNNYCLMDTQEQSLSIEELSAILHYSVIDSGLPGGNEIDVDAIRHSYIIYLVQQGMRLSDLELIIGEVSASTLSGYSIYSPATPGRSFNEIDFQHPALMSVNL